MCTRITYKSCVRLAPPKKSKCQNAIANGFFFLLRLCALEKHWNRNRLQFVIIGSESFLLLLFSYFFFYFSHFLSFLCHSHSIERHTQMTKAVYFMTVFARFNSIRFTRVSELTHCVDANDMSERKKKQQRRYYFASVWIMAASRNRCSDFVRFTVHSTSASLSFIHFSRGKSDRFAMTPSLMRQRVWCICLCVRVRCLLSTSAMSRRDKTSFHPIIMKIGYDFVVAANFCSYFLLLILRTSFSLATALGMEIHLGLDFAWRHLIRQQLTLFKSRHATVKRRLSNRFYFSVMQHRQFELNWIRWYGNSRPSHSTAIEMNQTKARSSLMIGRMLGLDF